MSIHLIVGIERNPGPAFQLSDMSFSSSSVKEQIIEDKFSIVHYNVQGLVNKFDLIESELRNFWVICLSETWLDDRMSHEDIRIGDNAMTSSIRIAQVFPELVGKKTQAI